MSNQNLYLKPETLSKLSNLELRAKLVVEGFITGLHKSPFHGFSVEFSQHRPYNNGDSLRFIDWKVLGRTDRYYIKQYEEETNLKSNILLDISNSMNFSSNGITKLEFGKYLCAALTYMMLLQRDAVGLTLFDDKIRKIIPPRSVLSYLKIILKELEEAPAGKDTEISNILHVSAEQMKRRGLVILISDLLDDWEKIIAGLRHFRHNKHEVLVFHVLDTKEIDFEYAGDTVFEDLESGEKIRTFPWYIKSQYKDRVQEFVDFFRKKCRENQIDYQLITTDQVLDVALSEFLIKRMRLN